MSDGNLPHGQTVSLSVVHPAGSGTLSRQLGSVTLEGCGQQWDFVADAELDLPFVEERAQLITITAEIETGVLGAGWFHPGSRHWVVRDTAPAKQGVVELQLRIPYGASGGRLVFDNWTASGGPLRAVLHEIRVGAVGDADPEADPDVGRSRIFSREITRELPLRKSSTAFSSRLLTLYNTILYIDPSSGLLQHGPRDDSPMNLKLVADRGRCHLLHEKNDTILPVMLRDGRLGIAAEVTETPLAFEPVALRDGRIGLRSGGLFLGVEGYGNRNVNLSAVHYGTSQTFCLWDAPRPRNWPRGLPDRNGRAPTLSMSCLFAYPEPRDPEPAIRAIESTLRCIAADCLYWFSNQPYPKPLSGIDVINVVVPAINDFPDDVNKIYLEIIPRTVATDFNLIVQPDGFAVNPQAWDDSFWDYDYIGAPWPLLWGGGPYWGLPLVGNGGFSLRSRKLYDALLELRPSPHVADWRHSSIYAVPQFTCHLNNGKHVINEDFIVCVGVRDLLEDKYGIKFCPAELANKFSVEQPTEFTQFWLGRSFGFHSAQAAPYYGVRL